jgi:hypothetical protein
MAYSKAKLKSNGDKASTLILIRKYIRQIFIYTEFTIELLRYVGFEVLTAVVMKCSIFWDVTLSSPLKLKGCFGGTCHLHLQGLRISRTGNERAIKWQAEMYLLRHKVAESAEILLVTCLHVGFLLGLFFYPENGGDIFLQNLSTDYMAISPTMVSPPYRGGGV